MPVSTCRPRPAGRGLVLRVSPALVLVAGALAVLPAPPTARAADDAPTMAQTFTQTLAPVPSFLTAASGRLSLSQQTVAGLAQQRFGETAGLSTQQRANVQSGFISSLTYPAATTKAVPSVVDSAVGVLTDHNSTPESSSQPGCTPNTGGTVSRVSILKATGGYQLAVTSPERDGFAPAGTYTLPTYSTGGPLSVAVIDPSCGFDSPSAIAVTYVGGIDFYSYDGTGRSGFDPAPTPAGVLVSTAHWLPSSGTVLASAHTNADASYLHHQPSGDSDDSYVNTENAELMAVSRSGDGTVVLHHLRLGSLRPGDGTGHISETVLTVPGAPTGAATAALAYDDNSSHTSDYVLALRSGSANTVWFGEMGDNGSGNLTPDAQPGACAGSTLPALSVAAAPTQDSSVTGVACSVTSGGSTKVTRWSNFSDVDHPSAGGYPSGLNAPSSTTLSTLTGARPFVTWPCELLSDYAARQDPQPASCRSDLATDVVGTPSGQAPRLYQLPTLDAEGGPGIASRPIAGAASGAGVTVDQLPLDPNQITVRNSSTTAVRAESQPTPVLYLMPAPMVAGLDQPASGPPTSFGTTTGSSTGSTASFSTSVGGTVSATIGSPEIAAADLSVSAEKATGTSQGSESSYASTQSLNDNANEPFVVYLTTPVWRWTGKVTSDSTGVSTTNAAQVVTDVAINDQSQPPSLRADSVDQLADRFAAFRSDGIYGPTLRSVFGAGVYGGTATTVADADPASYPHFEQGSDRTPLVNGASYCDTHTGASGVTDVNSGVSSPYTPKDVSRYGSSALFPTQAPSTVEVGDSGSDNQTVTIGSSSTDAYSTEFSVNASAGLSVAGVSVTADVGFTQSNETSVSATADQSFGTEIGHIKGASGTHLPAPLKRDINRALAQTETYTWEPFVCHRTTAVGSGGQASALVLGFATDGFSGLPDVGEAKAPTPLVGGKKRSQAHTVEPGSKLTFRRHGVTGAFQVELEGPRSATLTTPVQSPAQAAHAATKQSVKVPASLGSGLYRWRPVAVTYNGDLAAGPWRYLRLTGAGHHGHHGHRGHHSH